MLARKWILIIAAALSLATLPAVSQAKAQKNLAAKKTPAVQVSHKKATKMSTTKKKSHHKKKHTAGKHAKHKSV